MPNNNNKNLDNNNTPRAHNPKLRIDNFKNLTIEEQLELIDIVFERRRKKINELINKALGRLGIK